MYVADPRAVEKETKKARIGVRHLLVYKDKSEELKNNYRIADEGYVESMNPKDKNFIYF